MTSPWSARPSGRSTAVSIPEIVDFTKITDVEELWASASIPNGYLYPGDHYARLYECQYFRPINGVPVKATVNDSAGTVPTTITVTINLDPANQPLHSAHLCEHRRDPIGA